MLDSLEIVLDYIHKMKYQVIIIGDLNVNFLKNYRNMEKVVLQTAINVPTRIHKNTKSAIDQIVLNPELWGFKTEVLETSLSHQFRQYFK
jgi:hypothetical protein